MSRKWERMVAKNQKTSNKTRAKQGREAIPAAGREQVVRLLGRSWILPLILLGVSFVYAATLISSGVYPIDAAFWITFLGYVVLAALIFWLRRPVLRVGKTQLSTRRFSGDRIAGAEEIDEIQLSPSHVVIQLKKNSVRWIFTRFLHRFPVAEAAGRLKHFAAENGIKLIEQSK